MLLLCNNCHNVIVCYTLEGLDNIQSERGSSKVKSSPRTGEPPRNQQPDKDPDEDYKPRPTPGGPPSACQRSVFRCCFTQHQIIFDCIFLEWVFRIWKWGQLEWSGRERGWGVHSEEGQQEEQEGDQEAGEEEEDSSSSSPDL